MYLKFVNDLEPYVGTLMTAGVNRVRVTTQKNIAANGSGFRVYRDFTMKKLIGDYRDYTKIVDSVNFILEKE